MSDAMASARPKPVKRMIAPAIAVAMKAYRSVRMCWKLPSTLRLCRLAFRERPAREQVHDDADERDGQHQPAANVRRREESADGFDRDQRGEHEERDAVDLC
jgi:uncharacterized protein YqeY